jgi:hypothetical protein
MSESESAPSAHDLLVRFNKLRDYVKSFLAGRVDDNEEAIEDLQDRVADVETDLAEAQQRLDALGGLAKHERSTPDKRALDLKDAMIKAAQEADADGVTWWKDDVRDSLAGRGHSGLHKPDLYDAMDSVADEAGFEETTKHVTKDGRTYDARAVRVKLHELPGGDSR